MDLRDYQQLAVSKALESLGPSSRLMIGAPTGTGKSLIAIELQRQVPGSVILTPSKEIIRGFKAKNPDCEVYTMVKYRNMLMKGCPLPSLFIIDEGHQSTETTSLTTGDLFALRL